MTGFDHDKRIRWRDRLVKIGMPILISVAILSLMLNTVLGIVLYNVVTDGHAESQQLIEKSINQSNAHHNQTNAQNVTIENLLNQIKALDKQLQQSLEQHSADLALLQQEAAALSAAEAKLSQAGNYIAQFDAWISQFQQPLCQLPGAATTAFCSQSPPVPPAGIFTP